MLRKLTIILITALLAVSCDSTVIEPMDYSADRNWMVTPDSVKYDVDVFYIYPTCFSLAQTRIAPLTPDMKLQAWNVYGSQARILDDMANMYVPYYRQASFFSAMNYPDEYYEILHDHEPRADIIAALDYYFENFNQGRPYILAGHSQGSFLLRIVLEEYMKEHPDYLKRMVVCYALGASCPKSWYKANPHLKYAKGETDTGVVVAWSLEGPGAEGHNYCTSKEDATINPLNWKTDGSYAGVEMNLGSYATVGTGWEKLITPGIADAQIDTSRISIIVTTQDDFLKGDTFGTKSLHKYDWSYFIMNIRQNAEKRVEAYFKKTKRS